MYRGPDRRKTVEDTKTRDLAVTALNKIDYHIDECSRRYASIQRWMIVLVSVGGLQLVGKVIDLMHK